ncbi:hypothetical protein [Pseudonocardia sp. H11422]|nr:hypothetical protein [Pseudonocardia sp. H11422]
MTVAHGLVDLELAGRFQPDADLGAVWAAALRRLAPANSAPNTSAPEEQP